MLKKKMHVVTSMGRRFEREAENMTKLPEVKEGDVLTEQFIKSLGKDGQELCHQLNRRTEFQVLRTTYKLYE